ncbi:uncharacterized protein A4U43_C07F12340 [Asparagus officinalis]|uniref:Uncharacterized protein n=1 Tax=Asparagus officinalis TaxID=4686 RepID=A0A5P1EEQ2_ASPOF|nr:uncharacterized protein A4U43_C07F12340 [Asparagus officinalis]
MNSSSSLGFESDDNDEATEEGPSGGRKRKRGDDSGSSGGGTRKMMTFFEGLMRQVMERQEAMQQRFLEVIEKREHDRMIREEAWWRRGRRCRRLACRGEQPCRLRSVATTRFREYAAIISFPAKKLHTRKP